MAAFDWDTKITSTGPGAANAVPALLEAGFAGTPALHLTGQTSTRHLDRRSGTTRDVPDQLGMLRSVSKAAYRIRAAQETPGVLMRAAAEALTPPTGPVSLEIPFDIQRTAVERPSALDCFSLPIPAPAAPSPAALDELARRVAQARRPSIFSISRGSVFVVRTSAR